MAIVTGPLQLEGRVGDLIFYRRGNKLCCRSAPQYNPDSMTAPSKQSAGEFGKASKAGKLLRDTLNGLWPLPYDSGMVNRLNKALYSALRQDTTHKRGQRIITPTALQDALKGFRFNSKASLHFQVNTTRQAGGRIQVALPEKWLQLLKRPRFASHVQLQVAALSVDFETGISRKVATATECIALNTPGAAALPPMQLQVKGDATTIVVLQVRFIKEEANGNIYTSAELACMLSCVIAVHTPEKQQKRKTTTLQVIKKTRRTPRVASKPRKAQLQQLAQQRRQRHRSPS